jgi:hypothetical protein
MAVGAQEIAICSYAGWQTCGGAWLIKELFSDTRFAT